MPKRSTFAPTAFLAAGVALAAVSAVLAYAELAPPFALATSDAERFRLFAASGVSLPLATSSRADQLTVCYRLSEGLYARAQPAARRDALLQSCIGQARSAVRATPTLGIGWAIAGALAGERGDAASFNHDLTMAQEVAPAEQWQAEFRVAEIEQYFGLADPELQAAERRDLAILVRSQRGIRSLAARWVSQPGFRERVTSVAETLSPEDQRRFLQQVRQAAQADAPS